jgi:hypothetical protein
VQGILKTPINGAHKHLKFGKYASQYLGALAYRFNRRFDRRALVNDLISHAATGPPTRERQISGEAEVHD